MKTITPTILTVMIVASIAVAITLFITLDANNIPPENNQTSLNPETLEPENLPTQQLKKFSSLDEIKTYLKNSQLYQQSYYSDSFQVRDLAVSMESAGVSSAAPEVSKSSSSDYSTTNIQVKGVDEADFVKNDGKYIYNLVQDNLVIVNAYPAEDAEIISKTEIIGNPKNLFLSEDKVIVFTEVSETITRIPQFEIMPRETYTTSSYILIYDVSDKSAPVLEKNYSIEGDILESRMINNYIYTITTSYISYYSDPIVIPAIKESSSIIAKPDVYYFDNPESSHVLNTITSISLSDNSVNVKSFLMGYSDSIYVSENSIFVTYQKNFPYYYQQQSNKERFFDVIVPLLPSETRAKIQSIEDSESSEYEKWQLISSEIENMYSNMNENEKESLLKEISAALKEYDTKLATERQKTVIHKIEISDGNIDYAEKAEVPGTVLNQFSMDENNGEFRIATTTSVWISQGSVQYNNVYVLDESMNIMGKLEKIAPDESIYSTRFAGDRLYMVTFKRIDPLFVIDLSDSSNPKILGELKIPGYSDYLHPYDENHIIGIGKQTSDNEWGGVSIKGVKLALFDVSDVSNPKQTDSYEIGEAGTDSEALNDHKAFLFNKDKNILVIPIREVTNSFSNTDYYSSNYQVWHGAYVFSLTPEEGFNLKGKVTHYEEDKGTYYYWYSENTVKRSLYIDNVLYTISLKKIIANNLDDMSSIKTISLPYKEYVNRDYPILYAE